MTSFPTMTFKLLGLSNSTCNGYIVVSYLHGDTHGVAEVDDDEGNDGEPLLLGEGGHGAGAGAGVPLLSTAAVITSPLLHFSSQRGSVSI